MDEWGMDNNFQLDEHCWKCGGENWLELAPNYVGEFGGLEHSGRIE
jgi:hypothetical protein